MSAAITFSRVAGREMSDFVGKKILLLGKVESVADGVATVSSADGTKIQVQLAQDGDQVTNNSWYQFKGPAESPTKMTEYAHSCAGDGSVEIDLPSYLKLCELSNGKFSAMFKE